MLLPGIFIVFDVWIYILENIKFANLKKKKTKIFLCLRILHISFPIFICFLFVASLIPFFFCIFKEGVEYNV